MDDPDAAVPVTLLSGFLGAGKTTLLNHLLRQAGGRRLAVLVNDFGDVNVDAHLVEHVEGDTLALTNGCICCTRRDDLVAAMQALRERPERPEHIVVEASGVSDPWAIAGTLRLPGVRPFFRLGGVITVVDAGAVAAWRDAEPEALVLDQLRAANLIVLNKIDLVGEPDRDAAMRWLERHGGGAPVLPAAYGRVDAGVLLGTFEARTSAADPGRPPADHPAADHGEAFATASFYHPGPMRSLPAVQQALRALPASVLRGKGWIYLEALPEHRILVQQVGRRIDFEPGRPWGNEPPHTRLVFISRGPLAVDVDEVLGRAAVRASGEEPAAP